ncbi:MAG: hypothetical protein JRJ04_15975 [Deltaproteobacteria bacterium]|nr:hypothetical protein [Deltaproteobacteria bacterium]
MAGNEFPVGFGLTAELVPLFKEELVHCKVQPGETVVLFSDSITNPHYPAAFLGAAKDLGAYVFELRVPFFTEKTRKIVRAASDNIIPPKGPLEAMKAADIVIDMSTVGWLYTNVHNEVLKSGTRTLMVSQPPEVLRRLKPDEAVKRRTLAAAEVLQRGKKLRLTSPAGTDLTFDKTGRKAMAQYGVSDIAGRWDHWPSGQVACAPIEGSAEGLLVIDVGDVILRINRYVSKPIRCEFNNGKISKIEGAVEAFLLREYMAAWEDDKAYIPAHVGWGTEHRAVWTELALPGRGGTMDAESYYGDILLGMGANYFIGLGGENVTQAHIDFCLRNCNFWVDDLQVIKEGNIVVNELK